MAKEIFIFQCSNWKFYIVITTFIASARLGITDQAPGPRTISLIICWVTGWPGPAVPWFSPKHSHIQTVMKIFYRVSHNWVLTLFCLFSWLPMLIQRFILPFFNSPGDNDSKTHLTFLPMSKIDQVTEQNVRQTGFRYYYFGTYKVYLNCI